MTKWISTFQKTLSVLLVWKWWKIQSWTDAGNERKSILQWLHGGNAHCPLTRKPLTPSQLAPNNALKKRIRRWSMEHGLKMHEEEGQEANSYYANETGCIGILSVGNGDISSNPEVDHIMGILNNVLEISTFRWKQASVHAWRSLFL